MNGGWIRERLTSGGIDKDHIATPAIPPAMITAPKFNCDGSDPAGVSAFLHSSYATKYLLLIIVNYFFFPSFRLLHNFFLVRSSVGNSKCFFKKKKKRRRVRRGRRGRFGGKEWGYKERTYAALPGPSRASVAPDPRKILFNPPSLYNALTTATGPLYAVVVAPAVAPNFRPSRATHSRISNSHHNSLENGKRGKGAGKIWFSGEKKTLPWPCTCNTTLILSAGAATSVVGMAEKNPANASSEMVSLRSVRSGVRE